MQQQRFYDKYKLIRRKGFMALLLLIYGLGLALLDKLKIARHSTHPSSYPVFRHK